MIALFGHRGHRQWSPLQEHTPSRDKAAACHFFFLGSKAAIHPGLSDNAEEKKGKKKKETNHGTESSSRMLQMA